MENIRTVDVAVLGGGLAGGLVARQLRGYLERELGGHQYLVAETFTLADVSVACQLVNLRHAGVEIDAGSFPTLAAWFGRIVARPSLKALIEQDQGFLSRLSG